VLDEAEVHASPRLPSAATHAHPSEGLLASSSAIACLLSILCSELRGLDLSPT
jgi:hypothetical protein